MIFAMPLSKVFYLQKKIQNICLIEQYTCLRWMVSAQMWWQPPGDSGVLRHKGRCDHCAQHGGRDGLVPEHDPVTFVTII